MHFEPIPGEKGARLVFGLEWRAYANKGAAGERRRYASGFAATHFVELKFKEETVGGFCSLDSEDRKGGPIYSAAARIALLDRVRSRPAVLVLVQDGQRVHLVHVVRGAVVADEEHTVATLDARREEIEAQCAKSKLTLSTLGHGDSLPDIDEDFELRELLSAKKAGPVKKLPMRVPSVFPLLVIGAALVYGVSLAIDTFNPPPPPAAPPQTYMQEYQKAVAHTLAMPAPLASVMAPALMSAIGRQQSNVAGWQFQKASCNAMGKCSVIYSRQGGTFKDFDLQAPASIRPVSFNADGLHLSTRGPEVTVVERVALADAKNWPDTQALIKLLQTDPQRLSEKPNALDSYGYVVDIKPAQRILSRQPMAGEVRGPLVQSGNWQIDGYRWQSALLARLPSNMALDTLEVEFKGDGKGNHFTAKGKYYVLN